MYWKLSQGCKSLDWDALEVKPGVYEFRDVLEVKPGVYEFRLGCTGG